MTVHHTTLIECRNLEKNYPYPTTKEWIIHYEEAPIAYAGRGAVEQAAWGRSWRGAGAATQNRGPAQMEGVAQGRTGNERVLLKNFQGQ